jgi:hypothetical protein
MAIQFIVGDDAGETVGGSTPLQVQVTITEGDFNGDGFTDLKVDLANVGGFQSDLRGFFFNASDDSLLSQLTVTGADITDTPVFDTDGDGIPEISSASPPDPEATIEPLAFEAGLELGTPGTSSDDIGSTSFIISSAMTNLSYDLLVGEAIGIRATSVGEDREGSSKLTGTVPEPEPEPGSISGFKINDLDGDGFFDPGEPGLGGWTINLFKDGILVGTTATASDGSYSFSNLEPGNYTTEEVLQNDWTQTLGSTPETLVAGENDTEGNNFLNTMEEEPPPPPPDDGGFHKDVDIEVDIDLEFDVDVDVDVEKDTSVSTDITSDIDIDGSTAELTMDAQAIGEDSLVEVAASVLTVDNELSSLSVEIFSAAG